jgi:GTPase SAR1 family protein
MIKCLNILMIGADQVGKSSFIETLTKGQSNTYNANSISFICFNVDYEGITIKVRIWETSLSWSTIIYDSINNFDFVISVCDLTNISSFEKLCEFQELLSNCKGLAILGLKNDLVEQRQVPRDYLKALIKKINTVCYKLNALNDKEVKNVFKMLLLQMKN